MKKEAFKNFAKLHPELIIYLKNNSDMSWQKLYEIYDIYGEDDKVWSPYFKTTSSSSSVNYKDILKSVNVDNLESHINNFQKAVGVLQEFTKKGTENLGNLKGPLSPRPISKFFGD